MKKKILYIFLFTIIFVGIHMSEMEVNAATSGVIPCSSGSVTWRLTDDRCLILSGNGTTDIDNNYLTYKWYDYWESAGLNTWTVKSVVVEDNSSIVLDTCEYMFYQFTSCKSINLSGIITDHVTNMGSMFSFCYDLEDLNIENLKTDNVTDMSSMFFNCNSLENLNIENLKTNNVIDLRCMFYYCRALKELDVTHFNTSKVQYMGSMFDSCESLEELDVTHFNTDNVISMGGMFRGCRALKELDVTHFNTEQVVNMSDMFSSCKSLESLDLSNFNTSNVTDMSGMFLGCESMKQFEINHFVTDQVLDMSYMFAGCDSLEIFEFPNFNTSKVEDMSYMFKECKYLKELDLSNFDTSSVSNSKYILWQCNALRKFITPKNKIVTELPGHYSGRQWVDSKGHIYSNYIEHIFNEKTELYLENIIYSITYINAEEADNKDDLLHTYTYDDYIVLPSLSRECFEFDGWYLDSDFKEEIKEIEEKTTGDMILYAKWKETHDPILKNQVNPTCCSKGYSGDTHCKVCDKKLLSGYEIGMISHDYDIENGTVLEEATTTSTGTIEYKCKNCTHTLIGTIPKLKGITENEILDQKNDDDIEGSSFSTIQARIQKTTNHSIKLKWNQVKEADGYVIYGNKCGKKNRYNKIATITNNKKTTYNHKKLNGKKLKKGTYYKYIIMAYKEVNGEKASIAVSKTIHVTTSGGKYGCATAIKLKTDKKLKKNKNQYALKLKKNATYKVKASEVNKLKKIKKHRKIAFESTDTSIATVSKKGSIKAIKSGTCYIYVYAQNGVFKKIKVTVK